MKEGWTYKKLGEVAQFINGDRGRNYPSQNDFVESGIPFINAGHLNDGKIDFESMNYINEAKFNSLNSGKIKNGDILFCLRGSLGKRAIVNGLERGAIASSLVILRCETVLNQYLYYFLGSPVVYRHIQKSNNGSSQPNLSAKSVSNFVLPIPSSVIQSQIVAELDLLSGIIEKKKEQLKAYDQLAQSIFYTMFGDPIDNPKGWEVIKLGEGLSYIKNGANIKQTKGASGIPITRIETLSGGVFNRDRLGYADILSTDKYSQYVMEDMDILMSHINSKAYIGRSVVYRKEGDETIIHGMNLLRLKVIPSLLSSVYLDFFFKSDYFKDSVARIRKDAVNQSSMAISDLVKIPICVPPLSLQQEFAEKVEAIERQKALVQQSIEETQTMFDCTMDKYFG